MTESSCRYSCILAALALTLSAAMLAAAPRNSSSDSASRSPPAVTLSEDANTFTLFNGLVFARIEKRSGTLVSLHYQGVELLAQDYRGTSGGYWSFVGRGRTGLSRAVSVRINPAANGGEQAEVSCRLFNDARNPKYPLDADYRYSLRRGERWLYAYAVLAHHPGYPALGIVEGRYCLKLNPKVFDFLNVDADRRRVMPSGYDWDHGTPLNLKEARRMTTGVHKGEPEHKYDYSALFSETPAYGWLSTKERLGLWLINPSLEYVGGGPTKFELTGHLDVNRGGLPILLDMWLGSHYGGTTVSAGTNESWTKVVGPFLLYCNAASFDGGDKTIPVARDVLWKDALARAKDESSRWPYAWVSDTNYPAASERATLKGSLSVRDAFDPGLKASNLWVGVSAPDWVPLQGLEMQAPGGFPPAVDWQRDAKFYQFWTRADVQGRFTLRNVRPGSYTLHALADGVLGEFTRTNIVVGPSETKELGQLEWSPVRHGRTLWQIGVPNRTAREFRHGDHYWQWGLYFDYPKDFPSDVNFNVGVSDWRRDWNYVQPPHILSRDVQAVGEEDEEDAGARAGQGSAGAKTVRSTPWSIRFWVGTVPHGKATLRLTFCGTHRGCNVEVSVNGRSLGRTGSLPSTSAMQRDGIGAYWLEKDFSFDAALLQAGTNVLQLLSRADNWSQGVMYDCVRLELDESAVVATHK